MNLLLLKLGHQLYRGDGGGGGSGGDSGDSGDDSATASIGQSDTPGQLGEVTVSADAPPSESDAGLAATLADMALGNQSNNTNGIAGQLGVENPTLAAIVNHGISMAANVAMPGLGGIAVGLANSAINGNPASAASGIGSAIASAAGIPGAIGGIAGQAIGNMSGVPSSSVPGDPSGGGSHEWTASPIPTGSNGSGMGAISGGLGMGSTGNAQVPGLAAISGTANPDVLRALQKTLPRAGDVAEDNPLVAALRGGTATAYRV